MKVGIIGGGFSGLACATKLAQAGFSVEVFEKNDYLGGLAAGFKNTGWHSSVEYYYHHWFKSDKYVEKYLEMWGLEGNLRFLRPTTVMETNRSGFVQLDSAGSLLKYPELKLTQKLRMGMALAFLKSVRNWKFLDDVTAREWCVKWMGKQGFEAIWEPLLIGKFGKDWAEKVNMAWLWSRLFCRTPSLGTYEGGFGKLFEDIEIFLIKQGVKVHKGCQELKVTRKDDKWVISQSGETEIYDELVIASSPSTFAKLVGRFAPEYSKKIVSRPSLGAQVIILSLKKSLGKHYWYSLRKNSRNPFLALIEHTKFVNPENFGGEHLIYLADYVDASSQEWTRSDEELKLLAIETCEHVNNKFHESDINWYKVFREPYAQPVVGVGAFKEIPQTKIKEISNLYHASMAHVYPWDRGTNFALEIGEHVAREIIKNYE